MIGSILTDEQWSTLKPELLASGVYGTKNLRLTVEGILYRVIEGCKWRKIPEGYGDWRALHKRLTAWSETGKIRAIFDFISSDCDLENVSIDSTVVSAHQHSSGARKGKETAIGKSVGGNTSKIHAAVDSFGRPVDLIITEGQVHDSVIAKELIENMAGAKNIIADKAYDGVSIRQAVEDNHSTPIIPKRRKPKKKKKQQSSKKKKKQQSSKKSKEASPSLNKSVYKLRHKVENFFARLKHKRAIATRYDKLKRNYEGTVLLGSILIWLSQYAIYNKVCKTVF